MFQGFTELSESKKSIFRHEFKAARHLNILNGNKRVWQSGEYIDERAVLERSYCKFQRNKNIHS